MKKGFLCMLLAVCLLTGCKEKVNYIEQGSTQLEEQKYEDAVDSFQKSLEVGEDAAEAYRGLGMAYYEQQNYEAAREAFQNVIAHEGDVTPVLYSFIGACALKLDDAKGALDAYEKGLELAAKLQEDSKEDAPDYSAAVQEMRFNEILCYEKQSDWETARSKAEAYIEEYPDDEEAQKEAQFLRTR